MYKLYNLYLEFEITNNALFRKFGNLNISMQVYIVYLAYICIAGILWN